MLSELRYRLRALFRRNEMERDLADELQFHLDRLTPQARSDFGGVEQVKEACRDERGTGLVDRTGQDLRYAWRMFRKHPGFTIAVVGTLGLGIGGATTMFGVVDGVLLKPLPYRDADRIVQIGRVFGGVRVSATSAVDYEALGSRAHSLSQIAVARTETIDVTGGPAPEQLRAAVVSASYFDVLGVAAAAGQVFAPADDRSGARPVVVISDAVWRRRLGATANAVGQTLLLNGQPHLVVAVMPPRFRGPEAMSHDDVDLWLPLGRLNLSADPDDAGLGTIARIGNGIEPALALREIESVGAALTEGASGTSAAASRFWTAPLRAGTVGDAGSGLWMLFGAVSLLLVIACTNVANLFLVRATERRQEIAVRAALGAGKSRIARQLVTETLCFSLAGGAVGAALAYGGIALVRVWAPIDLPRIDELSVDPRVLLFAFVVASLAGLAFGIVPALGARRSDFSSLRSASITTTAGRSPLRQRGWLVVLQTALAAMLVAGATLLANSVLRLANVPPGFDPSNVVWVDVSLPERAYSSPAARMLYFDTLLERLGARSGTESVSLIQGRPLGGGNSVTTVAPEGQLPAEGQQPPRVPAHVVAPGYFSVLRIPFIDGRDFNAADRSTSSRVAIVSRAFADRFWPGERAIGRRLWVGRIVADAPPVEIVGVVEDVRQYMLDEAPVPMLYRAFTQIPRGNATVVVRHDGSSPTGAIDQIRGAAWSLDAALPLERAGTMEAAVSRSIREPKFRAMALSAFGVIACAIAAVGLYGALAWLVRARSRELGIRIALGADARGLRSIVLRQGLLLAGAGVGLGLAGAAAVAGLMESLVFGISPLDGPTYVVAATVMLLVALSASWLPARRAARLNPIAILRE